MMLTGKNIKAGKAKRMGLVDGLVKPLGEFLESLFEKKNDNFSLISLHSAGTRYLVERMCEIQIIY